MSARRRPPRLDTQRRREIRDSARFPAAVAVDRIRIERHATRGLALAETGYASLAVAWLAAGWAAR